MRKVNYQYLASHISNISRIPVRVYQGREKVAFCDPLGFSVDPASPYLEELLSIKKEVCYYITPFQQYYGILKSGSHTVIIGPTYQVALSRQQKYELMFLLGIDKREQEVYQKLINGVTPMPLDIFLHELVLVYYSLTGMELSISDVFLAGTMKDALDGETDFGVLPTFEVERFLIPETTHNTIDMENQMLSFISEGNVEGLERLFSNLSVGQAGVMADNYFRQLKNTFIVTATLASRAAIQGGLFFEDALSLSDSYIQRCEKCTLPERLIRMQYQMVLDFASRVADICCGVPGKFLVRDVALYVNAHITEELSVKRIADELSVSYRYLSSFFKKQTGIALSAYIQRQKIKKAKKYLAETTVSLLDISIHLGYSSQGYFQNVFKKETGVTPREYRETARKKGI